MYCLITIQLGIVKKNQYFKKKMEKGNYYFLTKRKEIINKFEKAKNILTTSQSSGTRDAKVCQPNIKRH
jgi:hypothetical protein